MFPSSSSFFFLILLSFNNGDSQKSKPVSHNPTRQVFPPPLPLSVASSFASIISLCFINSFKSLSYFYTIPIILLLLDFTHDIYPLLFSNLHRLQQPHPLTLSLIDTITRTLRIVLCFYPKENSLQVVLFFFAVTVNAMAITKLLKGWKEGKVFQHLMFVAVVRVSRIIFFHGWGFVGYLYGFLCVCLNVLLLYFQISEGLIKWGN